VLRLPSLTRPVQTQRNAESLCHKVVGKQNLLRLRLTSSKTREFDVNIRRQQDETKQNKTKKKKKKKTRPKATDFGRVGLGVGLLLGRFRSCCLLHVRFRCVTNTNYTKHTNVTSLPFLSDDDSSSSSATSFDSLHGICSLHKGQFVASTEQRPSNKPVGLGHDTIRHLLHTTNAPSVILQRARAHTHAAAVEPYRRTRHLSDRHACEQ
jgi:hypothetical protein